MSACGRTRTLASPVKRRPRPGPSSCAARSRRQRGSACPAGARDRRDIGYVNADYGFDYQSCGVLTAIKEQSREIAQGVNESLEARAGTDPHELGAGGPGDDVRIRRQRDRTSSCRCRSTLAHAVARELAARGSPSGCPGFVPTGRARSPLSNARGVPQRVHTVVVAAQHDPIYSHDRSRRRYATWS